MCQDSGIKDSALRENQVAMVNHLNSNQNHHSLYVLPTGSGKTKVVLMDAISRNVCHVIFVPLLAIREDIFKVAQADYRLRMRFWNSINTDFASAALDANIVVASFEHATQAMISFFQCLERNGRLGFCFVDEVDILLHKYRTFRQFWSMCASCPLVKIKAMTATLRPRDKPATERMLGVKFDSELRLSCKRDDVAVSCRFTPSEQGVVSGLQCYVDQLIKSESTRILIFCMTIAEAEFFGELLKKLYPNQVAVCHSERRESLNRISVVTSCVASGVNVEGLSHIVIVRSTWSVESFVQVRRMHARAMSIANAP
jgi:superfamily II DNA helicase RecQ